MKLIARIKLQPTPEQADSLKRMLEIVNAAANYVSEWAWNSGTFRQYDLHRACYYETRQRFNLSAQVVVRLIARVADGYKLDRTARRTFKPHGSIAYDQRILSWRLSDRTVSIWTVGKRLRIPFIAGEQHVELLRSMQGETDLIYRQGEFYLHQVCEVDEAPADDIEGYLGFDPGMVSRAADDNEGTACPAPAL